jgi:hypothetical protein
MVVLYDFTPCVDDELEVKRGQIVNILYRENDWVYVIGQDSRQEGFIPHSYCAPYNTQLADLAIKKKIPRNGNNAAQVYNLNESTDSGIDFSNKNNNICDSAVDVQSTLIHSQGSLNSVETEYLPFSKDPSGRFIVLYTFIARDENDVSVERGEFVTVLNKEDPDWYWIVRSDGQEGFIPSGFVYPAENILQNQQKLMNNEILNSVCVTSNTENLNEKSQLPSNGIMVGNSNSIDRIEEGNKTNVDEKVVATCNTGNAVEIENLTCNNFNPAAQVPQIFGSDDLRYHGTELVMLYDYKVKDI